MSKPSRGRPAVKHPRQSVTIRMSGPEYADAKRLANCYTGGNVARWLRFAALACVPSLEQAEALRST